MSQKNVENVRRGIDAWNRADLDEWLAGFTPEAELHTTGRFPDQAVYRGRTGLERYWAEIHEAAEEVSLSISELRPIGDKVFQAVTASGRGKQSKVPVEQPIWLVTTVRDGLATRVETYVDRAEALEAAGLRE
jgi:ketosteroid isomerase-like protein